jgi:hypothetical protein
MQRSPRTRLAAASLAVVATLALAACGDDDDDTTDESVATETTQDVATTDDTVDVTTDDTTDDTTDETTDGTTDTTSEGVSDPLTDVTGGGEVGEREDYLTVAEDQLSGAGVEDPECVAAAIVTEDIHAAIEEAGLTVEEFTEQGPRGVEVDDDTLEAAASDLAECGPLAESMADSEDQQACIEASFDNAELARLRIFTFFRGEVPEDLQDASDDVDACYQDLETETTTETTLG